MPLEIRRCFISGKAITSLDDFYDSVSRQLSFSGHFGRNLDALWDVLSTDIAGPVEILWEDAAFSREAMGPDFRRVLLVLQEVETLRGDFRVSISD